MYAEKETLARFEDQPLLGEEGMEAIDTLLEAHIGYEEAEKLHSVEIDALDKQIEGLEQQMSALHSERSNAVDVQHRARGNARYKLEQATSNPKSSGNNEVYAAVIWAASSDGQGKLWYPDTLANADETGKSFVAFDKVLRGAKSQPALLIERERYNPYTNVYVAETMRKTGLRPTKVEVEEQYAYGRTVTSEHVALALPVNRRKTVGFQLSPNFFNGSSLEDYSYDRGVGLRKLEDSFSLLLPRGSTFQSANIGVYDVSDTEVGELKMAHTMSDEPLIKLAVGRVSVEAALHVLHKEFSAQYTEDRSDSIRKANAIMILTQLASVAL